MEVYNNNVAMRSNNSTSSGLNPHAAPYVPAAQRAVEDFSPQWWHLVHSSPWFTDYWLRERFLQDDDEFLDMEFMGSEYDDDDEMLPDDLDAFFYSPQEEKKYEEKKGRKNDELKLKKKLEESLIPWGSEKWMGYRRDNTNVSPKFAEKVPKIVNVKVSPKAIQQPK